MCIYIYTYLYIYIYVCTCIHIYTISIFSTLSENAQYTPIMMNRWKNGAPYWQSHVDLLASSFGNGRSPLGKSSST